MKNRDQMCTCAVSPYCARYVYDPVFMHGTVKSEETDGKSIIHKVGKAAG